MSAKKGLGRGFDSLIPTELLDESFDPTTQQDNQVSDLRLRRHQLVRLSPVGSSTCSTTPARCSMRR